MTSKLCAISGASLIGQLVKNLIPGLGRSPGERKGYPLQYSGLENSMDYSLWGCIQSDTTEQPSLNEGEILFKKPDFTMVPCFLRFSRPGQ